MAQECSLQMPEDFVMSLLPGEELKDKYRRYLFRDYVEVCVRLCGSVYSDAASRSAFIANDTPEACGKGDKGEKAPCDFLILLDIALNLNHLSSCFLSLHRLYHQLAFHLCIFMQTKVTFIVI